MFCRNCGKLVDDGLVSCPACGTRMDAGVSNMNKGNNQPYTPPTPVNEVNNQSYTPPTPVNEVNNQPYTPPTPVNEVNNQPYTPPTSVNEVNNQPYTPPMPVNEVNNQPYTPPTPVNGINNQDYNSSPMSVVNNYVNTTSPQGMPPKQPQKFFDKTKIAIIAAVVVVIAGIAVAFASPNGRNTLMKMTKSSDDYFKHVMKNNLKDNSKDAAHFVGNFKENTSLDTGFGGSIEISAGDSLGALIEEASGTDVSEYIGWFENASIDIEANSKENKAAADLKLKVNKTDIGNVSTVIDFADAVMYMGIPDLNPTYLSTKLSSAGMSMSYTETLNMLDEFLQAVPDEKLVEKLVYKYVLCAVEQIDGVKESKETVKADGISQKATQLSVNIDMEDLYNICVAVLNELKEDKDVQKVLTNLQEVDLIAEEFDDLYEEFATAIDEALEDLQDVDTSDFSSEESLELNVWVNGKGEIIGIGMSVDDVEAEFVNPKKGSKYGVRAEISASGDSIKLEGNGKESGNKCTGELDVTYNGIDVVLLTMDDLNMDNLKQGIFTGSVTIEPSEAVKSFVADAADANVADIVNELKLTLKSESDSMKKSDAAIELYYDEELCAGINLKGEVKKAKSVNVPQDFVESNNYTSMETWSKSFDYNKLLESLRKAKLPEEWISMLESNFQQIY